MTGEIYDLAAIRARVAERNARRKAMTAVRICVTTNLVEPEQAVTFLGGLASACQTLEELYAMVGSNLPWLKRLPADLHDRAFGVVLLEAADRIKEDTTEPADWDGAELRWLRKYEAAREILQGAIARACRDIKILPASDAAKFADNLAGYLDELNDLLREPENTQMTS